MKSRALFSFLSVVACLALIVACASTDAGITTKVKTKMAADDTVKAVQIEVDTQNGVVTLTGNVDDQAAKARAIQIARDTKGVVRVVDMISARTEAGNGNAPDTNRSLGERIDDAEITMSVKSKLLDDPLVKGLKIDVDTREGIVYLTGSVRNAEEKAKAIQLAQQTNGVRDVQANLKVG